LIDGAVQAVLWPSRGAQQAASGRATTLDRPDGLTKLLIDPETEHILGEGIVGVGAGELISEGTLAIEMGALASDLKLTIHPHPTLSENGNGSGGDVFRRKRACAQTQKTLDPPRLHDASGASVIRQRSTSRP
jgi:hypothetical protein